MMGRMRDMAKWVLYILIASFVGLMVFEWGADFSGLRQQGPNTVGVIEGNEIKKEVFDQRVRQAYQNQREQAGTELNDEQVDQIRSRVWESFVRDIILKKELEKLDIKVTSSDIVSFVVNNPPKEITENPQFQTNGKFDVNKYKQLLLHPDNRPYLVQQEQLLKEELPYQKLQNLVSASVIVTEQEVRDEYMQKNVKAKIEYLSIPVSAFSDSTVEINEEEVRQYYDKNKNDFKVQEKRSLNYVEFSTLPIPGDTAQIYEEAAQVKKRAEAGEEFAKLADSYSDDPSVSKNHGDLGYFDRKSMVEEFSEAAFTAEPGEVVGPVKTQFGLHLIKVFDKKVEDGTEKVKASHILWKFEPSRNTLDNAYQDASEFREELERTSFSKAADKLGFEIKKTSEFSENEAGQIPEVGRTKGGMTWAFRNEEGDVSNIFNTDQAYLVFQIDEIIPAGYRPFEEVKDICENRLIQQKRMDLANGYAKRVEPRVEQLGDFQAIASGDKNDILSVDTTDYFAKNIFVPKIGRAPSVVAAAFNLPLNTPSNLLETNRGYYFIKVKSRIGFDQEKFEEQRASIRNQLLRQKSQRIFNEWYTKLKEESQIKDNRYMFYRS